MIMRQRLLNSLFVYLLCAASIGALAFQLMRGAAPCPLCILQRACVIGVAIGPLLNLRFGIAARHYGFSLIAAMIGCVIALIQVALHACPDTPHYGLALFGFEIYTWSLLIFCSSLLAISLLLMIYEPEEEPAPLSPFQRGSFLLLMVISVINIFACW